MPVNKATAGALFALIATTATACAPINPQELTCSVTGKETVYDTSEGTSTRHNRIYTIECGTLEVRDSWGNPNSADTYGSIQPGNTYRFQTRGYRNGYLSTFPNIIHAEHLERK